MHTLTSSRNRVCFVFKLNASLKNQMPEYVKMKYSLPGLKKKEKKWQGVRGGQQEGRENRSNPRSDQVRDFSSFPLG